MQTKLSVSARELSLEQWLGWALEPGAEELGVTSYWFPSAALLDEYLATVGGRSEAEVLALVERLLLPSCTLGIDARRRELVEVQVEFRAGELDLQYWRRLLRWVRSGQRSPPPWEGLTWIIDLLPYSPARALEVIDAYLMVHLHELPEGRIHGLDDARQIIRARFIEVPGRSATDLGALCSLRPRQLECLVAHLYAQMGYEVELTPATRDGGRDLVATRRELGEAERLFVEIKRVARVGVEVPRALLGAVTAARVNKGVVVTTGTISRPAREFMAANNMEGVDGLALVELLAAHCGHGWSERIAAMIARGLRRQRASGG